jgi:hypothetical protein
MLQRLMAFYRNRGGNLYNSAHTTRNGTSIICVLGRTVGAPEQSAQQRWPDAAKRPMLMVSLQSKLMCHRQRTITPALIFHGFAFSILVLDQSMTISRMTQNLDTS